jgi:hypothetical protein
MQTFVQIAANGDKEPVIFCSHQGSGHFSQKFVSVADRARILRNHLNRYMVIFRRHSPTDLARAHKEYPHATLKREPQFRW